MTKHMVFSLIILLLAAIALTLIATSRIADFKEYHLSLARESVASAAQEITRDIGEKRRLVEIFGYDHLELILSLAKNPQDEQLHEKLLQRVALYFPDYFTFTIADTSGRPFMEDFDGLIGDLCASDLSRFANTGEQYQRIHPHPDVYHFDVLARLQLDDVAVILFISFHAEQLGSILKSAQATGHHLMLVNREADYLIEVTETGSRVKLDRVDYRLTEKELQHKLVSADVANSHWTAIDFHDKHLFTNYVHKIIIQSVIIFILFLIVAIVMLRLIQKEERLRKKAEANKDEFISMVSHELRTPITSISGSLSLAANGAGGELPSESRELLELAQGNCKRMNLLIDDLLDLQKIEAGKMEFDIKPTDLDRLLKQCIEHNRGYADRLGATLVLLTPHTRLWVNVDEHRIMQVMANLLSNAVKYGARNDTIEIVVDIRDRFARVSVSDHGAGVPENFRENVFKKFAQAGTRDGRTSRGTGLGLSIVRSIIDQHGGYAGYRSESGEGSTFFIDLPLASRKAS